MADGKISLLMMVLPQANGTPMAGESQSVVDARNDSLVTSADFGTFKFGSYVEIEELDFGISLLDTSSSIPEGEDQKSENSSDTTASTPKKKKENNSGKFAKFIQGENIKPAGGASIYPPLFDEVSITRKMDKMSPLLFQKCFKTLSLGSVSILKRIATGTGNNVNYMSFLRLDFKDVLITDMTWSHGDNSMVEKMKFVYRGVNMQYRPQNNAGTPGSVVPFELLTLLPT